MSCLINSLELPKTITMEWPDTQEEWEEFGRNYVCVVNGQELDFAGYEQLGDVNILTYSPNGDDPDNYIAISFTPHNAVPKSTEQTYVVNVDAREGEFEELVSLTLCKKEQTICGTPVCDDGIITPKVITPTVTKLGNEYAGVSTNDKPTGVPQYSIYFELDTGKFYYYDNGSWSLIPCGSGGDDPQAEGPKIVLLDGILAENVYLGPTSDDLMSIPDIVAVGGLSLCGTDVYCFDSNAIGMELYFSSSVDGVFAVEYYVNGQLSSNCTSTHGSVCGPFELTEDTTFNIMETYS